MHRTEFELGKGFVAARTFAHRGALYLRGDRFPVAGVILTKGQTLALWEKRLIETGAALPALEPDVPPVREETESMFDDALEEGTAGTSE